MPKLCPLPSAEGGATRWPHLRGSLPEGTLSVLSWSCGALRGKRDCSLDRGMWNLKEGQHSDELGLGHHHTSTCQFPRPPAGSRVPESGQHQDSRLRGPTAVLTCPLEQRS